jgi:polyisoprenoid-binding protein YceI
MGQATITRAVGAAALIIAAFTGSARADALVVKPSSTLEFTAKITGGSFVAKSGAVSGKVDVDMASGAIKGGEIAVKAASFETGMDMRDKHMRDKYLKAKQHPAIRLVLTGGKVMPKSGSKGKIQGKLIVLGKEKAVTLPVKVTSASGKAITVTSEFTVNIEDFGIKQPKFMVVKMDKTVRLKVRLELKG